MPSIFGYFDQPNQSIPAYDPGPSAICPGCQLALDYPFKKVNTFSLMVPGDNRSYFYRVHKDCLESMSDEDISLVEETIVSAVYTSHSNN